MKNTNEKYQKLKDLMNSVDGVSLKDCKGKSFYFPLYVNKRMLGSGIEALDLSVRSSNALQRAGIHTIGALLERLNDDPGYLRRIRNCGAKSVAEIMENLFLYQYNALQPEHRNDFLLDVAKRNHNRN